MRLFCFAQGEREYLASMLRHATWMQY
eukprot:COSAG06_NODE_65406_length_257_cov_0.645570_1_plen_26_part_10